MDMPNIKPWKVYESARASIWEIKKARKKVVTHKATILMIHNNGMADMLSGETDDSGSFLFCEQLGRVWTDLHPVYLATGEIIYIAPATYHGTIDIREVGKIAGALHQDAIGEYKPTPEMRRYLKAMLGFRGEALELRLTDVGGTCDPAIYSNSWSMQFSTLSYKILTSKVMAFLEEMSNVKKLLMIGLSMTVGMLIGASVALVFYSIVAWVT